MNIITKKVEILDEEVHNSISPVKTRKGSKAIDSFNSSAYIDYESKKEILLNSMNFDDINDSQVRNLVIFERSMVSNGVMITEHVSILDHKNKLAFTSVKNFWIGVIFLAMMVIPNAITGPLTLIIPCKHPLLKAAWRTQGNVVISVPIMFMIYYRHRSTMSFRKDHNKSALLHSMLKGLFGFVWVTSLVVGCSMTLTSHANVMYSSTGVYLTLFAIITCKTIHWLEYAGYTLFAFGVFLMFSDPYALKRGADKQSYLGDLIPFLGAGCGALMGYLNHQNTHTHPFIQITQFFVFCLLFQFLFFPFFVESDVFYTFDPDYGVFGWMSSLNNFVLVVCVVSPITGVISNIGFFTAYQYFPMEIIAACTLIQPFISQVFGVLLGQDEIPGFLTCAGLTIIALGFLTASYGVNLKQNAAIAKIMADSSMYYDQELVDKSERE